MSQQCRAVCGHCFRTFMTEIPEEKEFCWKCGQELIYISGSVVEYDKKQLGT